MANSTGKLEFFLLTAHDYNSEFLIEGSDANNNFISR
jgi:hypothetical protein